MRKKIIQNRITKRKVTDTLDNFSHMCEIMKLQYGTYNIFFFISKKGNDFTPYSPFPPYVTLYHKLKPLPLTLLHIL